MDKIKLPIGVKRFRIGDFGFRRHLTEIRNPKSAICPPLSVLMLLMLFFSKSNTITAQKSTQPKMNWQLLDSLPNIGVAGAFGGVHNGAMMVAGGANFPNGMPWEGGKKQYHNDIYIFKKNRNGRVKRLETSFKLSGNIAYGASVSTPKGIVCMGGENENGVSDKVFLMRWNAENQAIEIEFLPSLPLPLTNCAAILRGSILYVSGGESDNKTTNSFLSLDINDGTAAWKILPNLPKPISHAVTVAQSDGIYVIGGRAKTASGISDLYNSVFKFDTKQNIWIPLSNISDGQQTITALTAGTGIAIDNQYIVLFGGDKGETFHQVETLLAAIAIEKEDSKKQELVLKKNQILASHPGFSKDVLLYNTQTNKWSKIGTIPLHSPVTTTAFRWGKRIIIPSGEIRAGVRTPYILAVDIQNEK
ncbi:MAG: hypothetical protein JNL70_19170 [Saprospiraceae bacterium]|nr:hypothetical protein [Saprospiraceae bacterium]